MKVMRSIQTAAAVAAVFALAGSAKAAPIQFVVDPSSSLSIGISSLALGSGSGSANASGTASTDLTGGVLTLGTNSVGIEDISVANGNWSGTVLFADVAVTGVEAVIGMGDAGPVTEGDPGVYNLIGWTLSLVNGVVALAGNPVFTFTEEEPLSLTLEEDVLSVIDTSGPLATWSIPVSALVTFETLGQVISVSVGGNLLLTEVPEPGTLLLVGAGLAGLVATGRKRRA